VWLLVALAGGAYAVVRVAAPPGATTHDVVVAARDLTAGQRLTDDDLRTVSVPASVRVGPTPDEAAAAGRLLGRRVTVDVPEGLPIVDEILDGTRFGIDPPEGTVAVPIRLVDPAVTVLLRPGDHVDLVAPANELTDGTGDTPTVLASSALVLDVVADEHADDLADWATTDAAGSDPLVVVAVLPGEGHLLAASGWGSLGAVLVGRS
jgi:pilus assembly protein CpaB